MQRLCLRGIIMDMDGVLCDSEPLLCEAACRMFQERYRVRVNPADFKEFVGTGEDRYLSGVAEKYGIELALAEDKARLYAIYLEIIPGRLRAIAGAASFVVKARQRGLRLALATSADRIKMMGNLKEIGLASQAFDLVVTGDDVKRKKPHPDLFLLAAQRLALAAADCLVIEDAPNGIAAAGRAGMPALGLTTSFSATVLQNSGAQWSAPDLANLPKELLAMLAGCSKECAAPTHPSVG